MKTTGSWKISIFTAMLIFFHYRVSPKLLEQVVVLHSSTSRLGGNRADPWTASRRCWSYSKADGHYTNISPCRRQGYRQRFRRLLEEHGFSCSQRPTTSLTWLPYWKDLTTKALIIPGHYWRSIIMFWSCLLSSTNIVFSHHGSGHHVSSVWIV